MAKTYARNYNWVIQATLMLFMISGAGVSFGSESEAMLKNSQQCLLVITGDWDAMEGTLFRFSRPSVEAEWRIENVSTPVVIGRNGLAWGRGLHPLSKRAQQRMKEEGDGRAPAGVFALTEAFGFAPKEEAGELSIPYRHVTEGLYCIDDAESPFYNQLEQLPPSQEAPWSSAEDMRAIVPDYEWGVVVAHNADPIVPKAGSCIFIHIWRGIDEGTAGCTAMPKEAMEELVHWLDASKHPVLVQLPGGEYDRYREEWQLPPLLP